MKISLVYDWEKANRSMKIFYNKEPKMKEPQTLEEEDLYWLGRISSARLHSLVDIYYRAEMLFFSLTLFLTSGVARK
jgi:hypothetical protein